MERRNCAVTFLRVLPVLLAVVETTALHEVKPRKKDHRNAYATMMYMGTPRDYEFYVATRVLIKSLVKLRANADLIVIASLDVPLRWVRALEEEDGAKVVRVENINNPYNGQKNFDKRFKLTLNKLYAWSLVDYERVVMLDADNLFLQKTDELFQCGQLKNCAVFINPCIFHTGLFVLQPSLDVFKDMIHSLESGKENPDGADQGFICAYFPDLLDQPIVITFPGALWLKPWYWWSWPVLLLGIQWHENRRQNLGYAAEMPIVIIQTIIFLGIIAMTRLARPSISKLCYRHSDKTTSLIQTALKLVAIWSILAAYFVPFAIIPRTIHPLVGWTLYFLGSVALSSITINSFLLPAIQVFVPLIGIFGSLLEL
ncbi:putative glucuronosyltransferase PGSIP8 [Hibiscus syriacus]|uniref:Glucuronosyltransferase PGSIP8 n=1 Tax=Hibiscus syriacus TaxID=106335 RepID=A0A6A2YWT5_HIBSY|nr:putative glucuronosyltransferase PGSIP8 [Hibiscus syriacus]